jgi:hypothetical protein
VNTYPNSVHDTPDQSNGRDQQVDAVTPRLPKATYGKGDHFEHDLNVVM